MSHAIYPTENNRGLIAHVSGNGRREELHATVRSAAKSANRWKRLGFDVAMEWMNENSCDEQCFVIVKA